MMISIEECRQIFSRHGESYSEEQMEQIRGLVYQLAAIDYNYFYNNTEDQAA